MTKPASGLLLSSVVLALAGLTHLPRAGACTGPLPGLIMSRQVVPADGSTSVPTNVHIYVGYEANSPGVADQPKLRTVDGIDVAVNVSQPLNSQSGTTIYQTYLLVPTAPLRPNTKYQLLSELGQVPCVQDPAMAPHTSAPLCAKTVDGGLALTDVDGGAAVAVPMATFTTGAGPDEIAPVLTGSLSYTVSSKMLCSSGACCGPHEGFDAVLSWTKATAAAGPVFYELTYERGSLLLPVPDAIVDPSGSGTGSLRGIFLCSGNVLASPLMFQNARFVGRSGHYGLYALDLAGNRSQPLQLQVTLDCGDGVDGGADGPSLVDTPPATVPGTGGTTVLAGTGGALGTGGTTVLAGTGGALGTGGTTVLAGTGGALGTGGTPLTGNAPIDASPASPVLSDDGGCSCQLASSRNGGVGLSLLAFGMLLARRRRRRR